MTSVSAEPPHRWQLISADAVPPGQAWLGPRERRVERTLTLAHRLRDWRAGRWAAKLLAPQPGSDAWEVLAHEDGSPGIWAGSDAVATPLSISHRAGYAAAVLSMDHRPVGIDLELNESHTERFVRDFFSAPEAERCFRLPPDVRGLYASAVWSAKEAVLKCLRLGLNRDTRSVLIDLAPFGEAVRGQWSPFIGYDRPTRVAYDGWWTLQDELIVTLASEKTARPPR